MGAFHIFASFAKIKNKKQSRGQLAGGI